MYGLNKATLIGNVGRDPEIRHFESGKVVATFSLATSESYTKDGERITVTEWHNIVVWRGLAEIVEKYVKKGTPLYVEGRIRTRSWDDKDGNKRYTTEIEVRNLILLGGSKEESGAGVSHGTANVTSNTTSSNTSSNKTQSTGYTQEENKETRIDDYSSSFEEADDLPF